MFGNNRHQRVENRIKAAIRHRAARKVLYVEDNALMQGLMKQVAEKSTPSTLAGTAEEAIELIEKTLLNEIMLVDIKLWSRMSGIVVLQDCPENQK